MQDALVRALLTARPTLRQRWETLLRAERPTSPLANPDALVYLMDWTLDCLFEELRNAPSRRRRLSRGNTVEPAPCRCGMNPLLAYFQSIERAGGTLLREIATAHAFTELEGEAAREELRLVVRNVARREIESFCAVCTHGRQIGVSTNSLCTQP